MERSKVAYIISTPRAAGYRLGQMILPQLEAGTHGVDVASIFFFDDNVYPLRAGHPLGERIAAVAERLGILLMMCDACALERGLAEGELRRGTPDGSGRTTPGEIRPKDTVRGVRVGCFPDLYKTRRLHPRNSFRG
ncbi:MAG: DsrE family protein [Hydrogenibacillus schlegelii]|uniref:DsrE family protein n=1 Tax=Hydrogenibacillus schlegelii TaxID=1484 RepID=A0A947GHP2_HYDSH|nr:DsrE family protein [Hydrogenibacillus schlegelii]